MVSRYTSAAFLQPPAIIRQTADIQHLQERDADEIELHGDDAESVTIMLASFYNASHSIIDMLNHDQQGEDPQKGHQKLLRLVRLHAIATKYLAPRLLHALQSVFKSTLYECTYEGNIAELAQAVYAATTSTSDELRMSFIRYVSTHLEKLKTNPHFKEMVEDVPDMAVELLYHISEIMDKRILGDWGSWSECSPNNDP